MNDMKLQRYPALRDLSVWESKAAIFIVGKSQKEEELYVVLEIKRPTTSATTRFTIKEHSTRLRSYEIQEYLNRSHSQKLICTVENAQCIFGFIRLLESSYLLLVTGSRVVAQYNEHLIYEVTDLPTPISIAYKPRETIEESRYRSLLQSVEFTQGYYFSYTYDLTHTLQQQHQQQQRASDAPAKLIKLNDSFVWNYFALKPLIQSLGEQSICNWVVPMICGFICQKELPLLTDTKAYLLLIARRNRHFAGVRYLRRGADTEGNVGNDVETEQIVYIHSSAQSITRSSSAVQLRGSIPLFWSHNNYYVPNAPIQIETNPNDIISNSIEEDASSVLAFIRHFANLQQRFGNKITILNLISTQTRNREYPLCCAYEQMSIKPIGWLFEEIVRPNAIQSQQRKLIEALKELNSNNNSNNNNKNGKELQNLLVNVVSVFDVRNYFSTSSDGNACSDCLSIEDGIESIEQIQREVESNPLIQQTKARLNQINLKYISYDLHHRHSHIRSSASASNSASAIPISRRALQTSSKDKALPTDTDSTLDQQQQQQQSEVTTETEEEEEGFTDDKDSKDVFEELSLICSAQLKRIGIFVEHNPLFLSDPQQQQQQLYVPFSKYDSELEEENNTSINSSNCGVLQEGVFRTNCIDCLDRTNIGQFCYAKESLILQLSMLGITRDCYSKSEVQYACMDCWSAHGEMVARQYAGSGAMHRVDRGTAAAAASSDISANNTTVKTNVSTESEIFEGHQRDKSSTLEEDQKQTEAAVPISINPCSEPEPEPAFAITGGVQNAVVAVKRYTSNITSDFDRQQSIDLLLGVFQPVRESRGLLTAPIALWDTNLRPEYCRFDRQRKLQQLHLNSYYRSGLLPTIPELLEMFYHVYSVSIDWDSSYIAADYGSNEIDLANAYLSCAHSINLLTVDSDYSAQPDHNLLKKTFSQGSIASDVPTSIAPSDCSSARLFWTGEVTNHSNIENVNNNSSTISNSSSSEKQTPSLSTEPTAATAAITSTSGSISVSASVSFAVGSNTEDDSNANASNGNALFKLFQFDWSVGWNAK